MGQFYGLVYDGLYTTDDFEQVDADTFVLRLPMVFGHDWLALVVFIGGLSAAGAGRPSRKASTARAVFFPAAAASTTVVGPLARSPVWKMPLASSLAMAPLAPSPKPLTGP